MSEITLRRRTKQSYRHTRVAVAARQRGGIAAGPADADLRDRSRHADRSGVVGGRTRRGPALYHQVYVQLGLDKPVWVQYLRYLTDVLHGKLGRALLTARPVIEDIVRVFPATLELATVAIIVGRWSACRSASSAATHRGRIADQRDSPLQSARHSVPVFWLGMHGAAVVLREAALGRRRGRVDRVYEAVRQTRSPASCWSIRHRRANGTCFATRSPISRCPPGILGLHSIAYISRMTRCSCSTSFAGIHPDTRA